MQNKNDWLERMAEAEQSPVSVPPEGENDDVYVCSAIGPPPRDRALALFSKPTTRENFPIKLFESFALGFCVVHALWLVFITYIVAIILLMAGVFALIGSLIPIVLICVVIFVLVVALDLLMLSMSIGLIFRQKKALLGMIVFTVIVSIVAYFTIPLIPDVDGVISYLRFSLFVLSVQYVPPIIVGLTAFRLLR